jgi:hypothetical protein
MSPSGHGAAKPGEARSIRHGSSPPANGMAGHGRRGERRDQAGERPQGLLEAIKGVRSFRHSQVSGYGSRRPSGIIGFRSGATHPPPIVRQLRVRQPFPGFGTPATHCISGGRCCLRPKMSAGNGRKRAESYFSPSLWIAVQSLRARGLMVLVEGVSPRLLSHCNIAFSMSVCFVGFRSPV